MKRAMLVVCLALSGCGGEEDVGESGACASGIVLHDDFYVGTSLPGLVVRSGARRPLVAVDARTRIEGFDRAGLPHLERGDRVSIRGFGCSREVMLARRIAPQP